MAVAIVLFGPKAVGKTWIARVLEDRLGVQYVNADELIPRLQSQGREPHPAFGWLDPVVDTVVRAANGSDAVSIEATGAWPSDWELPERLAAAGLTVIKVWVWAPLEDSLERSDARAVPQPLSREDVALIYERATSESKSRSFDASFDTSNWLSPEEVMDRLEPMLR